MCLCLLSSLSTAQKFQVLHNFAGGASDGSNSSTKLTFDANGNLFGETYLGGAGTGCGSAGCGIAYSLSPKNGHWREKAFYSFSSSDGSGNNTAGTLVVGPHGVVYGVQRSGGDGSCNCGYVYQLAPRGGIWTQTILHTFSGPPNDGQSGSSGLAEDAAGNLYGTSSNGGEAGAGTVFELSPSGGGTWAYNVIYQFGNIPDASVPEGPLAIDRSGNIYGVAYAGGIYDAGAVFKLSPSAGSWTETILSNFTLDAGQNPGPYGIALGPGGVLYGTTNNGGEYNVGTVYELTPASGVWDRTVLYTFTGGPDGAYPTGGVAVGPNGAIYGAISAAGSYNDGNVFELVESHGAWQLIELHQFTGGNDGSFPNQGVTLDKLGNLYGVTVQGGTHGLGTIFEITP
jgi:uncharacterized repeat protein (TIGR03803 family)